MKTGFLARKGSLFHSKGGQVIGKAARSIKVRGKLWGCVTAGSALVASVLMMGLAPAQSLKNPILYVTQVPVKETKNTVVSIGGNHRGDTDSAPRGGDLMILYPNGYVRNLTREAGFGQSGLYQDDHLAIAVRDPAVHWSGTRALFSMVIGAVADGREFYWQIYEVSGIGQNEQVSIRRLPGQSAKFNNIQPAYTSSDYKIVFVSDSTRDQSRHLYPVQDEQGGGHAVTGLWELDWANRTTTLLEHSPSGSFDPFVDSFGRIVFSRWDHLQRDEVARPQTAYDFVSEKAGAGTVPWFDLFPEPIKHTERTYAHTFDLFMPWTINQDGTDLVTMNHLGRHELGTEAGRARKDSNLVSFDPSESTFAKVGEETRAASYLQISERRGFPGSYLATDAISNAVSAGRLVSFSASPDTNADDVKVTVVSNKGLARDPIYLEDGRLVGSISSPPEAPVITGTYGGRSTTSNPLVEIPGREQPFKLTIAAEGTSDLGKGKPLIESGEKVEKVGGRGFFGELWELQPVEVVARERPPAKSLALPTLESDVFLDAGVSIAAMKGWLKENDLALLVSRNLTARDENDKQQPYNLFVPGGVASIKDNGPSYGITNLQFFQGDYVRAYLDENGEIDESAGRRVAARVMHDDKGVNIPNAIPGSARIAPDGSSAMLVPARRALTWQTTDSEGEPVVRERYWLSFKAGEIRTCTACHGTNSRDQLGRTELTNPPLALKTLLDHWKEQYPEANAKYSPYAAWARAMEIGESASRDLDADLDGLSHFEEFIYGDDPREAWSQESAAKPLAARILEIDGQERVKLTFTRRILEDVRIALESSSNLRNWKEEVVFEGTELEAAPEFGVKLSSEVEIGQIQLVELTSLVPRYRDSRRYYRLRFQG